MELRTPGHPYLRIGKRCWVVTLAVILEDWRSYPNAMIVASKPAGLQHRETLGIQEFLAPTLGKWT